jgi:hypothetical protein
VHEVILQNQPDPAFNGNSQITLDRFELTVPDPGQFPFLLPPNFKFTIYCRFSSIFALDIELTFEPNLVGHDLAVTGRGVG